MPGPIANPRIIMLGAEAGTTAGASLGLQGDVIQFAGSRKMSIPIEVIVCLVGGTSAIVIVETDSTKAFGAATTWGTFTLTAANPSQRFVGRLLNTYIRARPTSNVGGGIINAYLRMGV